VDVVVGLVRWFVHRSPPARRVRRVGRKRPGPSSMPGSA